MKYISSFLILFVLILSCNSATEKAETELDYTGKQAKIEFTDTNLNLGMLKPGEVVEGNYYFTNSGEAPLIITNVKASCGCTTPSYTTKPIMPGSKGSITALFDSKGFNGNVYKTISVFTNANKTPVTLYLIAAIE